MIIVECYLDEFLIKTMGFPRKRIKHEGGKGKVLEKVRKNLEAVGIIDEDPDSNQPGELGQYIEKKANRSIKLLERRDDPGKRIIQISPYLEHWLLERARQNNISPAGFGLPDDPKKLHGLPHVEKSSNFHRFLKELIEIDEEIHTLREWIEGTL